MSKKIIVTSFILIALAGIFIALYSLTQRPANVPGNPAQSSQDRLTRFHSPTMGDPNARVTIVEFLDPACETCRNFYPFVKDILRANPEDVRLVVRYAPFHKGSDVVIKMLEAARLQGKFWPVLDAVLQAQPEWAVNHRADPELAMVVARRAGLDLDRARVDMTSSAVTAILEQEVQDLTALDVTKTPTFFVNGKPLPSFGYDQLTNLVNDELRRTKK